jgi:Rod binding domain-containing protein
METNPLSRHIVVEELPLERIAGNPQLSETERITAVSRHFEALLLRQFLTEAQKPLLNPKSSMGGASNDIYKDMIVNVLSDGISKSGSFGLAQFFQSQMVPHGSGDQKNPEAVPNP